MNMILRAAVLATIATVFFSCMSILIRHVSSELHPLEIVFFRNLLALMWMMPVSYTHLTLPTKVTV